MANSSQANVVSLPVAPWGTAHGRRGRKWHEHAIAFVERFPVGTEFSSTAMGEWAAERDLLTIPASKYDPEWCGYLQERTQIRNSIRNAGTHPRMQEALGTAFTIERIGAGWKVSSAQDALATADPIGPAASLIATKKRQFKLLCQGGTAQASRMVRELAEQQLRAIAKTERDISLRQQDLIEDIARAQRLIDIETRREEETRPSIEAEEVVA